MATRGAARGQCSSTGYAISATSAMPRVCRSSPSKTQYTAARSRCPSSTAGNGGNSRSFRRGGRNLATQHPSSDGRLDGDAVFGTHAHPHAPARCEQGHGSDADFDILGQERQHKCARFPNSARRSRQIDRRIGRGAGGVHRGRWRDQGSARRSRRGRLFVPGSTKALVQHRRLGTATLWR
jgi:hypothetical protein